MHEALHILRKDLVAQRHVIAVTWIYAAVVAAIDAFAWSRESLHNAAPLLSELIMLIVAGWMVALAVYEEAMPGTNQNWLTRPYHWRSLLAAKLLFVLVTVNLPLLLFQCLELIGRGYSPLHYWGPLLGKQLLLAQFFVTTILIIASCTKNLGQSIFVVFVILMWSIARSLMFASNSIGADWRSFSGVQHYSNAAFDAMFCLGLLWFQYSTRRTRWTWALLGLNVVLLPVLLDRIPASGVAWSMSLQRTATAVPSSVARIAWNASVSPSGLVYGVLIGDWATFPIRLESLPDNVMVICESDEIHLSIDDKIFWSKNPDRPCALSETRDGYNLAIPMDLELANIAANKPAHLYAKLHLVLLQREESAVLPAGTVSVRAPGNGICQRSRIGGVVYCFWPLRQPSLFVARRRDSAPKFGVNGNDSYDAAGITSHSGPMSPGAGVFLRTEFATATVSERNALTDVPMTLASYEPVAYVERELDVRNVVLSANPQASTSRHATPWTIFTHFLKRLLPHF